MVEVCILSPWDLPCLFGASCKAVAQRLKQFAHAGRSVAGSNLEFPTDLLIRHLKPNRIPGVFGLPLRVLNGAFTMNSMARGRAEKLRAIFRNMLRFERLRVRSRSCGAKRFRNALCWCIPWTGPKDRWESIEVRSGSQLVLKRCRFEEAS